MNDATFHHRWKLPFVAGSTWTMCLWIFFAPTTMERRRNFQQKLCDLKMPSILAVSRRKRKSHWHMNLNIYEMLKGYMFSISERDCTFHIFPRFWIGITFFEADPCRFAHRNQRCSPDLAGFPCTARDWRRRCASKGDDSKGNRKNPGSSFCPLPGSPNCRPFKRAILLFWLIWLVWTCFSNFLGMWTCCLEGVFFQKDSILYWEPPLFRAGKCKNPNADGTSSFQYLADYSNVINDHQVRELFWITLPETWGKLN